MKKKLFSLLTLALFFCSGAWASVVTWDFESNATGLTIASTGSASTARDQYSNTGSSWSNAAGSYAIYANLGSTKGSSSTVTTDASYKNISKIAFKLGTTDRGKTELAVQVCPKADFSEGVTDVQAQVTIKDNISAVTSNTAMFAVEYSIATPVTGYVRITLAQVSGSNNKKMMLDDLSITYVAAPTITVQPVSASYATGTAATALSVTATGTGTLHYQWYSNTSATTEGATSLTGETSSTYTPSTASEGTTYYYCAVTDDNGTTNSSFATITVAAAAAPTISIDASATSVTAGTSITLTAASTGNPTPTLKWYVSDTNDTSAGSEITGETADTYTFDAIAGTKYYYAKAFNSEAPSGVASNVVTILAAARTGCDLNQVVYSNGFDAFIVDPVDETHGTITAYYLSGASVPTITSTNKSGGATYTLEGTTLTLTSEDENTTKVYDVTLTAVEPYTEDGLTFNGTETWIKTGNAFSESKNGWIFSKNDNDWTREKPGKNRIYFFLAANTSITLTQGVSRAVKVYKNGSFVADKTGTFTVDGEASAYMLAVVSNQTSGDGSYKSISVSGAQTTVTSVNITPGKTYTTYVTTHDLDFTSHAKLTAYIATAATSSAVTLTSVNKVPAGTPIVLKATETGSAISVPTADETDDVSTNKLKKGDGFTSIGGNSNYDYILSDGQFYRAEAGVVASGKAYLHLTADPGAHALDIVFEENGGATGIAEVSTKKAFNGEYYNIAGQKVAQPTKGLYIVNGKKVIVR